MINMKRRSETKCVVFGAPQKLKDNILPTYADVMRHYLWVRSDFLWKLNNKDPAIADICEVVARDIETIWNKASIPIASHQQVIHLLKTYYTKYKNIKKCPKSRNNENKIDNFLALAEQKLFDVSVCKCSEYSKCKCKTKIPIKERDFLMDQRSERTMVIGTLDVETNKKLEQRFERKRKQLDREQQNMKLEPRTTRDIEDSNVSEDNSTSEAEKYAVADAEVHFLDKPSTSKSNQMRVCLPNLAVACDRTGVSDRTAAIIVSAVLQDIGVVTPDNQTQIIDRSKLRRERKKIRENLQNSLLPLEPISIFFDGRKDTTIVQEKKGDRFHRKTIKEEHVVILAEPNSLYVGHITPDSGSAENIRKCMVNFFTTNNINLTH